MLEIGVIGLGKLGLPLAAVFAEQGHTVRGFDENVELIRMLQEQKFETPEPELERLIQENGDRLSLSGDIHILKNCKIVYVIVPTSSSDSGWFDSSALEKALENVSDCWDESPERRSIVIVSTVMPTTCRNILSPIISKRSKLHNVDVIYSPEFIALGSVISNLKNPDMILVGARDSEAAQIHLLLQKQLTGGKPIALLSLEEAELSKLLVNAFVTMKISFANTIAELAEGLGIDDPNRVASAIGMDTRIGHKYLRPGFGFAGPCFPRDNFAVRALGEKLNIDPILSHAVDVVNLRQPWRIKNSLLKEYQNTNKIGIFGVTYKPHSAITEESQSLKLAMEFIAEGIEVLLYDPLISELPSTSECRLVNSIEDLTCADLVVVSYAFSESYPVQVSFLASKTVVRVI